MPQFALDAHEAHDARDREFAAFLDSASPVLERFAQVLCADPVGGRRMAERALADAYTGWPSARSNPFTSVRRTLLTRARGRGRRSQPEETGPESWFAVDWRDDLLAREALFTALGSLTGEQRALIAFRFAAGIPDAEVASELRLPPEEVGARSSAALVALQARSASLSGADRDGPDRDRLLWLLSGLSGRPSLRVEEVRAYARRRQSRRAAAAAAGLAVLLASGAYVVAERSSVDALRKPLLLSVDPSASPARGTWPTEPDAVVGKVRGLLREPSSQLMAVGEPAPEMWLCQQERHACVAHLDRVGAHLWLGYIWHEQGKYAIGVLDAAAAHVELGVGVNGFDSRVTAVTTLFPDRGLTSFTVWTTTLQTVDVVIARDARKHVVYRWPERRHGGQ